MSAEHDADLYLAARELNAYETARISLNNSARHLADIMGDDDGAVQSIRHLVAKELRPREKEAEKAIERAARKHPLGPHIKATLGLGFKQAGRLVAALGDPGERPNVDKLRQYAGHGDPERSSRRRGEKLQYSPEAKKRTHLCADKAVQCGVRKLDGVDDSKGYDWAHRRAISPLGEVYLKARASWADHDKLDGHKHNHALRLVGKTILRDLWVAARDQR